MATATVSDRVILKKYQDLCPSCNQAKSKKAPFCYLCSPFSRGAHHYRWRGDAISEEGGRLRARRFFELNPFCKAYWKDDTPNDPIHRKHGVMCRECGGYIQEG